MRAAVIVLLLVACGDTTNVYNSTTSAETTGSGGSDGDTGVGGAGGAPGVAVATTDAASTAETSSSVSTAEASASSTASSASTGTGGAGAGGEAPACEAAPCPGDGVVCDPAACGQQWSSCGDYVCTEDPDLAAHMLIEGLNIIRTPPIEAQHPRCADVCDDPTIKWSMRLRVLGDYECFQFRAPEGFSWQFANAVDDVPPVACGATTFESCDRGETGARYILVSFRGESSPGARLSVEVSNGDPCFVDEPPACDVGCNGAGG